MINDSNRVVVTGMGCISALGYNLKEFSHAIFAGTKGIDNISWLNGNSCKGGEVKNYEPLKYFSKREISIHDRFTQFALIACDEAINNSGLCFSGELSNKISVIFGVGAGGVHIQDKGYRDLYINQDKRLDPYIVLAGMNNAAACSIARKYNITGKTLTISTACSSSSNAIGEAFRSIKSGESKVVITGGSEACMTNGMWRAWESMYVMDSDTCRPFCKNRNGVVLGEGSGVLILESLEHAKKRKADIISEVVGYGSSADIHFIKPNPERECMAMQLALSEAHIAADDVDYINAHGTGTKLNDAVETQAIKMAFGDHAKKLKISSTKSMHGHTLGASGALESIATILAQKNSIIPPTINYECLDLECDLNYVPNNAIDHPVNIAVKNSFAFGGVNTSLVFKKF
ncbi:MAG: beta-ketoacyl-[acyl-carrier-protein] synthase family protein [Pseudomonadota bacterium]